MLELRPNCECCDKDLPPEATDALICTFECTFCADCVDNVLGGACPNCGGNFAPRPIRPAGKLTNIRRRPGACSRPKAAARARPLNQVNWKGQKDDPRLDETNHTCRDPFPGGRHAG